MRKLGDYLKPVSLWNPPRVMDWGSPLGSQRVCKNRGCLVHLTNRDVCVCGVPTEPLGGEPCEPSSADTTASSGKKKMRAKKR